MNAERVSLPGAGSRKESSRKDDVNDRASVPLGGLLVVARLLLVCPLGMSVSLPDADTRGGLPPFVLESIAGFKADMLGMKTMKGGISFDAGLPNGSFMRLPEMPLLSLSD